MRSAANTSVKLARAVSAARCAGQRRWLHPSSARRAITNLEMPAMSPTMTEGGIASWKKKEGESFAAGDVLLEIETDKATIDVEAQDDGVLGKIIAADGAKNVPVGKVIALLAEEGDDISNLEAPKEDPKPSPPKQQQSAPSPSPSSSSPPPPTAGEPSSKFEAQSSGTNALASGVHPTHSRTLFPSVLRLLQENGIADAKDIKGTGVRGMLTKGDVLAFLGKASGPLGTFKNAAASAAPAKKEGASKPEEAPKPLDGPALRRAIVTGMTPKARLAPIGPATFDSVIADYLPPTPRAPPVDEKAAVPHPKPTNSLSFLEGLV